MTSHKMWDAHTGKPLLGPMTGHTSLGQFGTISRPKVFLVPMNLDDNMGDHTCDEGKQEYQEKSKLLT